MSSENAVQFLQNRNQFDQPFPNQQSPPPLLQPLLHSFLGIERVDWSTNRDTSESLVHPSDETERSQSTYDTLKANRTSYFRDKTDRREAMSHLRNMVLGCDMTEPSSKISSWSGSIDCRLIASSTLIRLKGPFYYFPIFFKNNSSKLQPLISPQGTWASFVPYQDRLHRGYFGRFWLELDHLPIPPHPCSNWKRRIEATLSWMA